MSKDLAEQHTERELQELPPHKEAELTWYHFWKEESYFKKFK